MSESNESLVFTSLTLTTIPVEIEGKKFVLREATESAACKFRNAAIKSARIVDGKVVGMEGAADNEPLLVSLCLCPLDDNGHIKYDKNNQPVTVPLNMVLTWPPRIVKVLFENAKEISHLEEKGEGKKEELVKNLPETILANSE